MRKGFTLIELLVVIAIIAILAAILFPVFARTRAKARQASCQSNLKQIGLAILMYIQDYDEQFPGHTGGPSSAWDWPVALVPYCKNAQIFHCPSADISGHMVIDGVDLSYGLNCYYLQFRSQATVVDVAGTIMAADSNGDNRIGPDFATREARVPGCGHQLVARHSETLNITFVDGHVKAMKLSTITSNDRVWFDPSVF